MTQDRLLRAEVPSLVRLVVSAGSKGSNGNDKHECQGLHNQPLLQNRKVPPPFWPQESRPPSPENKERPAHKNQKAGLRNAMTFEQEHMATHR